MQASIERQIRPRPFESRRTLWSSCWLAANDDQLPSTATIEKRIWSGAESARVVRTDGRSIDRQRKRAARSSDRIIGEKRNCFDTLAKHETDARTTSLSLTSGRVVQLTRKRRTWCRTSDVGKEKKKSVRASHEKRPSTGFWCSINQTKSIQKDTDGRMNGHGHKIWTAKSEARQNRFRVFDACDYPLLLCLQMILPSNTWSPKKTIKAKLAKTRRLWKHLLRIHSFGFGPVKFSGLISSLTKIITKHRFLPIIIVSSFVLHVLTWIKTIE